MVDGFDGVLMHVFSGLQRDEGESSAGDGDGGSCSSASSVVVDGAMRSNPDGVARAGSLSDAENQFAPQACFSPDSRHVLCGSSGGAVYIWLVPESTGGISEDESEKMGKDGVGAGSLPILKLPDVHPGATGIVACSPTMETFASACSVVALWINHE